jgi:hypothetical protein
VSIQHIFWVGLSDGISTATGVWLSVELEKILSKIPKIALAVTLIIFVFGLGVGFDSQLKLV